MFTKLQGITSYQTELYVRFHFRIQTVCIVDLKEMNWPGKVGWKGTRLAIKIPMAAMVRHGTYGDHERLARDWVSSPPIQEVSFTCGEPGGGSQGRDHDGLLQNLDVSGLMSYEVSGSRYGNRRSWKWINMNISASHRILLWFGYPHEVIRSGFYALCDLRHDRHRTELYLMCNEIEKERDGFESWLAHRKPDKFPKFVTWPSPKPDSQAKESNIAIRSYGKCRRGLGQQGGIPTSTLVDSKKKKKVVRGG